MEYLYLIFFASTCVCTYLYMYKNGSIKMKMITASTFLSAGLIILITQARYTNPFSCLIFAGLVASFIGDYTLKFNAFGIKGLPGMISFATAHILYIAAFLVRTPPTAETLWLLIPWALIVVFFSWLGKCRLKINFDGAGPVVLIYAMIITVMVLTGLRTGITAAQQGTLQAIKGAKLCVAVLSFMISDCGVCIQMFNPTPYIRIGKTEINTDRFSSDTYFGAQILLASVITL